MEIELSYGTYLALKALSECDLFPLEIDDNIIEEEGHSNGPPRNHIVRLKHYVDYVIPGLNEKQFQSHFRINRQTLEKLLPILNNLVKKDSNLGRMIVDVERQLLAVLWLLATPDSYR